MRRRLAARLHRDSGGVKAPLGVHLLHSFCHLSKPPKKWNRSIWRKFRFAIVRSPFSSAKILDLHSWDRHFYYTKCEVIAVCTREIAPFSSAKFKIYTFNKVKKLDWYLSSFSENVRFALLKSAFSSAKIWYLLSWFVLVISRWDHHFHQQILRFDLHPDCLIFFLHWRARNYFSAGPLGGGEIAIFINENLRCVFVRSPFSPRKIEICTCEAYDIATQF